MPSLLSDIRPTSNEKLNGRSTLKESINYERWQQFHQDSRILCVDDHKGALQFLQKNLSDIYPAGVDIENNPLLVRSRLEAAQVQGRPYNLVILDLHMPQLSGIEVMKDCADLMPAVVIHTASMMNPVTTKLAYEIDRFKAFEAERIIESAAASNPLCSGMAVPIFLHHKTGSICDLVRLADTAMLTARHYPQNLSKFANKLELKLIPESIVAETIHAFAEDLRILSSEIKNIVNYLLLETELSNSEWWQKLGANVIQALELSESISYQQLKGDDLAVSVIRLHDLLTPVQFLEAPTINQFNDIPASAAVLSTALEKWGDLFDRYRRSLSSHYNNLAALTSGEIDIWSFYKNVRQELPVAKFLASNSSLDSYLVIEDPQRKISDVVSRIAAALATRKINSSVSEDRPYYQHLSADIIEADDLGYVGLKPNKGILDTEIKQQYLLLNYTDNSNVALSQTLQSVLPGMLHLTQENGFAWKAVQDSEQCSLLLAIELKSSNLSADEKATQSTLVTDWSQHSIQTEGKNIDFFLSSSYPELIAVGALPTDQEFGSPIILDYSGKKIFVLGQDQHIQSLSLAAAFIRSYFQTQVHWSELDDQCSRLYINYGRFTVKNKLNLAGPILEQFGIHPCKISES